jgi:peptide/nickel transport system ATP-binding protein
MSAPLLQVERLTKRFRLRQGLFQPPTTLTAVDAVSVTVAHGKSLGIVGESGSGKSTLARMIMALEKPDEGHVRLNGADLNALSAADLRKARRAFQMVFQDPRGSLDPRMTIERIIAEPLDVAEPKLGSMRRQRITDALEAVGLDRAALAKYPHEFSGGQRQRIAIARALVTSPALVVADEPVSALDVSVQAQVLNLMMDLQETRGLTYVFISHDLAVVEHVADDVIVMYRGRVVEQGPAAALFHAPAHPYTRALVDAVSDVDAEKPVVAPTARPALASPERTNGCAYAGACPFVEGACLEQQPALVPLSSDTNRFAACIKPLA